MLDVVREFGFALLARHGEHKVVRMARPRFCRALDVRTETESHGAGQATWLTRLERHYPNIEATLRTLESAREYDPSGTNRSRQAASPTCQTSAGHHPVLRHDGSLRNRQIDDPDPTMHPATLELGPTAGTGLWRMLGGSIPDYS